MPALIKYLLSKFNLNWVLFRQRLLQYLTVLCFHSQIWITWRRTRYISVRFATWNPFSALESPVVWISQNYIHKNVIMSCWIQTRDVET